MNWLITALVIWSVFQVVRDRVGLPNRTWGLIFLGSFLPLIDYLTLFFSGEPGLFWTPLYFHNPLYLTSILAAVALWIWIYKRDLKLSSLSFLPLLGLLVYLFLTFLTTEQIPFLRPLTHFAGSANLVPAGYLPVIIMILLLWASKRWTGLKTRVICWASLAILGTYIFMGGGMRLAIAFSLPEPMQNSSNLVALPDPLLLRWEVTSMQRDRYYFADFTLFGGWSEPKMLQTSNDFELAQTLLLDPYFLSLYVHIFKNPVIETKYDHEQLKLKVTELIPRTELFWTKSLVLTKTAGGQVLESDRKWGSLF